MLQQFQDTCVRNTIGERSSTGLSYNKYTLKGHSETKAAICCSQKASLKVAQEHNISQRNAHIISPDMQPVEPMGYEEVIVARDRSSFATAQLF
jgi:hypothetical protein